MPNKDDNPGIWWERKGFVICIVARCRNSIVYLSLTMFTFHENGDKTFLDGNLADRAVATHTDTLAKVMFVALGAGAIFVVRRECGFFGSININIHIWLAMLRAKNWQRCQITADLCWICSEMRRIVLGYSLDWLFFGIDTFVATGHVRALFVRATFRDILLTFVDI